MLNFLKKMFSPAPTVVRNTSVIDDAAALAEMQSLFAMLYSDIEAHRTPDLDQALFAQIILLMQSIKHYPPTRLKTWQQLDRSFFDAQYINELKNTPRTFSYGSQTQAGALHAIMGVEVTLPFYTTETILSEIADGLTINTLEHYGYLLGLCEYYNATTLQLMSLSIHQKTQLLGVLQSEHYATKFEHALEAYIESDLKDAKSFWHLTENILTFTAVDFMLKANLRVLPSRAMHSAPIDLPGYVGRPMILSAVAVNSVADGEEIFEFEPERHRKRICTATDSPTPK